MAVPFHNKIKLGEMNMSKRVLILSGSPRKGGNSDLLCDEFLRGAVDAGNEAEKIEVTFTTGEQSQGIEQVNSNLKVQKFIRDGQVIIKRGDKEFNVIGTEL